MRKILERNANVFLFQANVLKTFMRDVLELLAKVFWTACERVLERPAHVFELHSQVGELPAVFGTLFKLFKWSSKNRMLHAMRSIYRISCELLASGQRFWISGLNLWTSGLNFWTSGLNFFGWSGGRCLHSCDFLNFLWRPAKLFGTSRQRLRNLLRKFLNFLFFFWFSLEGSTHLKWQFLWKCLMNFNEFQKLKWHMTWEVSKIETSCECFQNFVDCLRHIFWSSCNFDFSCDKTIQILCDTEHVN